MNTPSKEAMDAAESCNQQIDRNNFHGMPTSDEELAAIIDAEFAGMGKERDELFSLLAPMEWEWSGELRDLFCPCCTNRKSSGHLSACRLGKALAQTSEKKV